MRFREKRRRESSRNISLENSGLPFPSEKNESDTLIEETAAAAHMKKILAEIAFLSKAYRDVMILYYLDGKKVKDIAQLLQVSEDTVKQRLFSARKTVKQEVKTMNPRNLSLQQVGMAIPGTGNPCGQQS